MNSFYFVYASRYKTAVSWLVIVAQGSSEGPAWCENQLGG